MSEETPPNPPAADPEPESSTPSPEFAQALDRFERETAKPPDTREPQVGARVRARVVSVGDEHLVLDIGARSEAIAETRLFRDAQGQVTAKPGDTLDLVVTSAADPVTLAPSVQAAPRAAVSQLREAHKAGAPVSGKVTAINAGGLAVDLGGVRGFCPFSQIESGFCADPSVYLGRTLEFLVTEMKEGRGGTVLSRKQLLRRQEDETARRLLETLQVGDERDGTVSRLEGFGAFIDLGGMHGLVHVSEIRHERTHHPKEALSEGEKVRVRVLRIENGKDGRPRVALSIKAARPDPWADIERRYPKGARVKGTVVRLTDFGAFIHLEPGIDGLVHVSEVSSQRVEHVKDALAKGQEIEAVVLASSAEKKRISLSIKAAAGAPAGAEPGVRGERGERGERRPRGRPERRGRPDPVATVITATSSSTDEPPMTTMAIALREAMKKAEEKERKDRDA